MIDPEVFEEESSDITLLDRLALAYIWLRETINKLLGGKP